MKKYEEYLVTQTRTVRISATDPGYAADLARHVFADKKPQDWIVEHAIQTSPIKITTLDVTEV